MQGHLTNLSSVNSKFQMQHRGRRQDEKTDASFMGPLPCFFVEVDQLTSACGEIHFPNRMSATRKPQSKNTAQMEHA